MSLARNYLTNSLFITSIDVFQNFKVKQLGQEQEIDNYKFASQKRCFSGTCDAVGH